MGAEITYKWVDTLTYDFFVTYYRDCRGISFAFPTQTKIRCESGTGNQYPSFQLKSITEITVLCDTATKQCNPSNTYGTGNGVEAHVYSARIDFRQAPFNSLLSCGRLILETSVCCRSGSGLGGGTLDGTFYTFAMIDLSKALRNNSPVFQKPYDPFLACKQPYYHNLLATEADGDSLSYSLACGLTGASGCDKYNSDNSGVKPLQAYWLSPLKYPYVNVNATPPMGIFIDSENGDFIATPTKCDEISTLVIEVKEWRKNSSGAMEHIGTTRREGWIIVSDVSNNSPILPRLNPYAVFEEDSLNFSILPIDKPYKKTDPQDKVRLEWTDSIPGAKYEIVDTSAIQAFRFNWKPASGKQSKIPYKVTLHAWDDECPKPGYAYQQYQIYVAKRISGKLTTTYQNCLLYKSNLQIDSTRVSEVDWCRWSIFDSIGNPINDYRVWFPKYKSRTGYGGLTDEMEIAMAGKYIIQLEVRHNRWFKQYFYDTIIVTQSSAGWFSKNVIAACIGDTLKLVPDSTDLSLYSKFFWNEADNGPSPGLKIAHNQVPFQGRVYRLKSADSSGCLRVDEILVVPATILNVSVPKDTTVCEASTYQLSAEVSNNHPLAWDTAYWSAGTAGLTTTLDTSGIFVFTARNECASYSDTIVVAEIPLPRVKLPEDRDLCYGDSLILNASFKDAIYIWSNNATMENIKISLPGVYSVEVTTICGVARDTVDIRRFIFKPQEIELGRDKTVCVTDSLMLDAGPGEVTYLWNTSDTTKEILVTQSGQYKVKTTNACGSAEDSVKIQVDPLLSLELGDDIETNNPIGHVLDAGNPGTKYFWNTGDTSRTIITKTFGKYWVKVSNACGVLSDTINLIDKIGVERLELDGINIYPNPGKGILNIVGFNLGNPVFEVFDVNGKFIPFRQETIQSGRNYRISIDAAPGVYTLIWLKGEIRHKKVFMIE